jgi:hypothetical protein
MLSMLSYGMLSDGMLSSSNDKLETQRKRWKKIPSDEPTIPRRECRCKRRKTWYTAQRIESIATIK